LGAVWRNATRRHSLHRKEITGGQAPLEWS
jgi:hypothetical protein